MAETTDASPAKQPTKQIAVSNTDAPILFFEIAATFANQNGIVKVMLVAGNILPTTDGGTIGHPVAVAYLCCSVAAAQNLRDTLDKALLLGAKTEGQAN